MTTTIESIKVISLDLKRGEDISNAISRTHKKTFGTVPFYVNGSLEVDPSRLVVYICHRPDLGAIVEVVQE